MEPCAKCNQPAPANELATYRGFCEDCFCDTPYNGHRQSFRRFQSGEGAEQFNQEQRRVG